MPTRTKDQQAEDAVSQKILDARQYQLKVQTRIEQLTTEASDLQAELKQLEAQREALLKDAALGKNLGAGLPDIRDKIRHVQARLEENVLMRPHLDAALVEADERLQLAERGRGQKMLVDACVLAASVNEATEELEKRINALLSAEREIHTALRWSPRWKEEFDRGLHAPSVYVYREHAFHLPRLTTDHAQNAEEESAAVDAA